MEERICLFCGKTFSRKKSQKDVMCSWECRQKYRRGENHWAYKGTKITKGAAYWRTRNKVGRATKCSMCNREEMVGWHHKDRNKLNNSESNLVQLCNKCHYRLHMINRHLEYFKELNVDITNLLIAFKG